MRHLFVIWLSVVPIAAMATDSAALVLEVICSDTASADKPVLKLRIQNQSNDPILVLRETLPWSPSLLSFQLTAYRLGQSPTKVKGPLAIIGHLEGTERLLPNDGLAGELDMSELFPPLVSESYKNDIELTWVWRGGVGDTVKPDEWQSTPKFSGKVCIRNGHCCA